MEKLELMFWPSNTTLLFKHGSEIFNSLYYQLIFNDNNYMTLKIIPFINTGNNIRSLSCDTQSLDGKYLSSGYIEKEACQGYHILKK